MAARTVLWLMIAALIVGISAACGGNDAQQSAPMSVSGAASSDDDGGNGDGVTIIEADDQDSSGEPAPSQAADPGGTNPLFVSAGVFADGPRAGGRFERATLGDPDAPVLISDYADFL